MVVKKLSCKYKGFYLNTKFFEKKGKNSRLLFFEIIHYLCRKKRESAKEKARRQKCIFRAFVS